MKKGERESGKKEERREGKEGRKEEGKKEGKAWGGKNKLPFNKANNNCLVTNLRTSNFSEFQIPHCTMGIVIDQKR